KKRPAKKKAPATAPAPAPAPEAPAKDDADDVLLSTLATKLSASIGIVVAMLLATFVNIYVARHYKRWDWTKGGLYTLSDATVATLPYPAPTLLPPLLLPAGEPLTVSVQHLLDTYRAESDRLVVEYIDPDRRPAEFLEIAQRYGVSAEKDEGRIVAGI